VVPGEVVAMLGPNGAGKTTALRALAGLQPADGRILLDGLRLDPLPPERRRVGFVPQDAVLLPHLSVTDNVAYGPRARGAGRSQARARAVAALQQAGLGALADARPGELSGGQAQRVALVRALVTDPALLLLDEPLAALDALARTRARSELTQHLAGVGVPTVLVTHDLVDALVLADRLVVLEHGRVVQQGPAEQVTREPQTPYVAGLTGLVLLRGHGGGDHVRLDGGGVLATTAAQGEVLVAVDPRRVRLQAQPGPGSWPVRVRAVEHQGSAVRVELDGAPAVPALLPVGRLAELDLRRRLWASLPPDGLAVYPAGLAAYASMPSSRRSLAT
jgi:molybdate transport system ATP-binding protein